MVVFYCINLFLNLIQQVKRVTKRKYNLTIGKLASELTYDFIFNLFIESAHWANSIQQSRCPCVICHLLVFPLFIYSILRPILTPLTKVRCPKILEIQNPWGKVLERSGLRIEHFCWEVVLNRRIKKRQFFFLLILTYRTWLKPLFPMDQRPLVKGYISNFGISLAFFEFFCFGLFFLFNFFFFGFCLFLVHPTVLSVLLSESVEKFDVSHSRDFLFSKFIYNKVIPCFLVSNTGHFSHQSSCV